MAYPPLVRQDGFQLPSPAQTSKSADDDRDDNMFHFVQKFPNFADELATLIETPHVPSHERSTFEIPYHHFSYDTPAPRSRSRSRAPSLGPTRSARRDRRANSISSHVSSTSPPPRPHPHAIHIPGRGNSISSFFVPNAASAPPDYNLPTPDSLSHSILHHQFSYPSSPYYAYQQINRPPTPSMAISPTDVDALITSIPPHVPKLPPSASSSAPIKQHDPETHLSEKRRRRRESHNAVERRRRDNINERIGELAGLIPGVLFESDGPLPLPVIAPGEDLFTLGSLSESALHVLPTEEGLPDLPEESVVKKDPCEEGESPMSPTSPGTPNIASGIAVNGVCEQSTIKANKGVILRKSVEYIRYLQQLVSAQAARGRDLEERNGALERELAILRGDPPSSKSSSSPSLASSQVLSMSSASSVADSRFDDLEMEDASVLPDRDVNESRGRQLGRARDKIHGMVM